MTRAPDETKANGGKVHDVCRWDPSRACTACQPLLLATPKPKTKKKVKR
jgi:hypothetical protein